MTELISLDQAVETVLGRVRPLSSEPVPLAEARGRVVAKAACSLVDLPPFRSSAMDGYAVRAKDTPGTLPVVFRIAAGKPAPRAMSEGEAMAIATGGAVPEGADAVVQHELVVETDNTLAIGEGVKAGLNVRPVGGDLRAGDVVVEAGVQLGAPQIGALAAAGVPEVVCARKPTAAVLATGTELKPPGAKLEPGEVYEANGVMLQMQLESAGAVVERLEAVADDESAHRRALELGFEKDVLVTSGGVSVGPHDLVRRVAADLGAEEIFWGVSVKPGKPVSFGVKGGTLIFGLPGNPVSSLVTCLLFVVPALLALQGAGEPGPSFEPGLLASALRPDRRRTELVRARRAIGEGGVLLEPVTGQESHMIARASGADALVLVPQGDAELPPGTAVRYLRLS